MELSLSHRGRLGAATESSCNATTRPDRQDSSPNSLAKPALCTRAADSVRLIARLQQHCGLRSQLLFIHFAEISHALISTASLQPVLLKPETPRVMKRAAAILALAVGTAAFMRPLHPRRISVELGAKRRLKRALSDAKKPKRATKKAAAPVRALDEEIAKRERPQGVAVGD